jgi:hypothetical protein
MQIIMECLIGWNFKLKKQTSLGIFGKVFGWCDTTEEQARFTLHYAPKKEATPQWVINLMSSVKRLEQKVDNTMDEVDALKKKETAKQELQTVIKSEKSGDENNVDLTEN